VGTTIEWYDFFLYGGPLPLSSRRCSSWAARRTSASCGFMASWPQVGVPVGLLLPTGMVKLMSRVTGSSFDTWGWRVPFLASVVAVGLYVRLRVLESPALRSTRTRCHRNN